MENKGKYLYDFIMGNKELKKVFINGIQNEKALIEKALSDPEIGHRLFELVFYNVMRAKSLPKYTKNSKTVRRKKRDREGGQLRRDAVVKFLNANKNGMTANDISYHLDKAGLPTKKERIHKMLWYLSKNKEIKSRTITTKEGRSGKKYYGI